MNKTREELLEELSALLYGWMLIQTRVALTRRERYGKSATMMVVAIAHLFAGKRVVIALSNQEQAAVILKFMRERNVPTENLSFSFMSDVPVWQTVLDDKIRHLYEE